MTILSAAVGGYADLCTETIIIEPYQSQDAYGVVTYSDPVSYAARVSGKTQRISIATGEERVSRVKIFVLGSNGIGTRDRLTMPTDWPGPANPPILAVEREKDELGNVYEWIYA